MTQSNIIVIMTDELRRDCLGCYGNSIVKTPNIDALAASGLRFDNVYTPSPICVPARAAFATGRYVHEIGCWANAQPYDGKPDSWHHKLRDNGYRVASIGKLHFRSTDDDNGFTEEIQPLHVHEGKGWVHGLMRERTDLFDASGFAANIGPGEDSYTDYDRTVCGLTLDWLQDRTSDDQPWAAFVSFLRPHYPLTCPEEFYALYDPAKMPAPKPHTAASGADHPVLEGLRKSCDYDAPFTEATRQIAIASYYGLISFVDDLIGQITEKLRQAGLDQSTTVIFASDHGECLGDRGFWTKMVMYDEAAAVPLIVAGPNISAGTTNAPASLIDLFPTTLGLAGIPYDERQTPFAHDLLKQGHSAQTERPILSEYHDYGAQTGMFMLRKGRWKLVVYPGYQDQLFDMVADPDEMHDLAQSDAHKIVLSQMHSALAGVLDTDKVNERAFTDQEKRIAELGGREAILALKNFDHTPVSS